MKGAIIKQNFMPSVKLHLLQTHCYPQTRGKLLAVLLFLSVSFSLNFATCLEQRYRFIWLKANAVKYYRPFGKQFHLSIAMPLRDTTHL